MSPRAPSIDRWLVRAAIGVFAFLAVAAPALGAGLPDTIERLKPSVVVVGTYQKTRSPAFSFTGSGFVVEDGTLIATNAHVVSRVLKVEDGETLMVLAAMPGASSPQARPARVLVLDKDHDLALLRITGAPLPAVTLGDSDTVREGQSIAFTGFPIGRLLGFHATTHRGIVAALTPTVLPAARADQLDASAVGKLRAQPIMLLQLDATIYAGHSGSPVYDEDSGEVLGIVNMGLARGIKDPALGQSADISFAVPTRYLRELIGKRPR